MGYPSSSRDLGGCSSEAAPAACSRAFSSCRPDHTGSSTVTSSAISQGLSLKLLTAVTGSDSIECGTDKENPSGGHLFGGVAAGSNATPPSTREGMGTHLLTCQRCLTQQVPADKKTTAACRRGAAVTAATPARSRLRLSDSRCSSLLSTLTVPGTNGWAFPGSFPSTDEVVYLTSRIHR